MKQTYLKEWIKRKGGSVKASQYLGVNRSTLWRWEQGLTSIPQATQMFIRKDSK